MFQAQLKLHHLLIVASLMMSACAHQKTQPEVVPVAASSPQSPASGTTYYTVVEFPVGQTDLSSTEQAKLKNLAMTAEKFSRPVSEIRVLAWSDDLESPETKLAAKRASKVRSLIKEDLKSSAPVAVYNMSAQPQNFADLIRDNDPNKKITFENTESTSLGNGPKSSLAGNKTSKAIVMIRYE